MRRLVILAIFAAGLAVSTAHAASFDCTKAATLDERTVCADPRLSELDGIMGRAFAVVRSSSSRTAPASAQSAARAFLATRRACGAERGCLMVAYGTALGGYASLGSGIPAPSWFDATAIAGGVLPLSGSLPERVGHCASTSIVGIGSRLETDKRRDDPTYFDAGTSVEYANKGYGVSYSPESAVIAARLGDKVVMCLTHIPSDCPKGDDRGRVYMATDLRTGLTWELPDSEHMCGGA
jgi:uncharacterized protein